MPYMVKLSPTCIVNTKNQTVINNGETFMLRRQAWILLEAFIHANERFLTFQEIGQLLWPEQGYDYDRRQAIKDCIASIRQAIGKNSIENRRNCGYRLVCSIEPPKQDSSSSTFDELAAKFIAFFPKWKQGAVNAIYDCEVKWGPFSLDEEPQHANMCEGLLALFFSDPNQQYTALFQDVLKDILDENSERGIVSKSLKMETVVPTSMYLYLLSLLDATVVNQLNQAAIKTMVTNLWNAHNPHGWGLYIMKQNKKNANIGCTYWAFLALSKYEYIAQLPAFQALLKRMFPYGESSVFGNTVEDHGDDQATLYATCMMFILHEKILSDHFKKGLEYNSLKALLYIVENFDNSMMLSEKEEIYGCDDVDAITVHYISWSHITTRYCFEVFALAIEENLFQDEQLIDVLNRTLKLFKRATSKNEDKNYWKDRNLKLDGKSRGKRIFPTMNVLVGLSQFNEALQKECNALEKVEE